MTLIIVKMGGFHLTCTHMGALGNMMRCSGLEEILIESGICAGGSMEKSFDWQHYDRNLRIHNIVLGPLERLLMQVVVVVNHCFTSLFGTNGLLSDIVIR